MCTRCTSPLHNQFHSSNDGQFYGYHQAIHLKQTLWSVSAFLLQAISKWQSLLAHKCVCMYGDRVEVNATQRPSSTNEGKRSVDNFTSLPVFQWDNSEVSSTRVLGASSRFSKNIDLLLPRSATSSVKHTSLAFLFSTPSFLLPGINSWIIYLYPNLPDGLSFKGL